MDIDERMELIKREPTEEIITEEELRHLLSSKSNVRAYDGFEPSGLLHLGSGLLRAIKLQDFIDAGIHFILYIADWFAYLNNKFGGDMDIIRKAGEYYIEGWRACGVDMSRVEVKWSSNLAKMPEYWETFLKISRNVTINRVVRSVTVMGRRESEVKHFSFLVYPIMQTTDIFMLKADICQLGIDQRKVNILAREIGPKIGFWKPIVVSHHLLIGLQGPAKMGGYDESAQIDLQISSKMSKSKPETCIYIHDDEEDIKDKIRKAYCPPKQVESNPILEICRYIIFRKMDSLIIKREAKYGGLLEFKSYNELEQAYRSGVVHPLDLKIAVAEALNEIIEPIRAYFKNNEKAYELYEIIRKSEVTR
ncbi:MAG: tyrosine--tRNA ligase [Candidatus Methanomethylicia archaeon]